MFTSYMAWQPAEGGPELHRFGGLFEYANKSYALAAQAAGPFTLFGRAHEAAIGLNGNRDETAYLAFRNPCYCDFIAPERNATLTLRQTF
jgi:outer membrane receptor for ferric coprogen and ferric-rhodotorulic acid